MIRRPLLLACLFVAALPATAGAETFVFPPSYEFVDSTASPQPFPFTTAPTFNYPYRYQQVYDAAVFTNSLPGVVLTISELRFRIDQDTGGRDPINLTDIVVRLSTTDRAVNGLAGLSSEDFDSNIGPDEVLVFDGSLSWDPCGTPDTCGSGDGPFTLAPFDQDIPFSTPFVYDPTAGNLLMEVYNLAESYPVQLFDALLAPPAIPTSRVRETINPAGGAHLFPTGFNEAGLITQFVYTVPEPGAAAAIGVALLALAGVRRSRAL